jgi:hypothetical protein
MTLTGGGHAQRDGRCKAMDDVGRRGYGKAARVAAAVTYACLSTCSCRGISSFFLHRGWIGLD